MLSLKVSQSSNSATVSMGSTAGRNSVKHNRSIDTAFGVVTPKRRTRAASGLFEGLLNGAVLTTPDGRTYGFTDMADMNVGAFSMQDMQLPQTPMGRGAGSGIFTTPSSSPDNWDLSKVTPNTRANMFAVSHNSWAHTATYLWTIRSWVNKFCSTSMSGTVHDSAHWPKPSWVRHMLSPTLTQTKTCLLSVLIRATRHLRFGIPASRPCPGVPAIPLSTIRMSRGKSEPWILGLHLLSLDSRSRLLPFFLFFFFFLF